jgi:hypothetical protein
MPISPEARSYAYAWGVIQAAVEGRANTASIFQAVRDEAESLGMDTPAGMWQAVNELRSIAVQMRNAGEAFNRASPDTTFSYQLAPLDVNARAPDDRALFPEYVARFDLQATGPNGEAITRTLTMRDSWAPGITVGDVTDAVTEAAIGMSQRYGLEFGSVGNIRPVSV